MNNQLNFNDDFEWYVNPIYGTQPSFNYNTSLNHNEFRGDEYEDRIWGPGYGFGFGPWYGYGYGRRFGYGPWYGRRFGYRPFYGRRFGYRPFYGYGPGFGFGPGLGFATGALLGAVL